MNKKRPKFNPLDVFVSHGSTKLIPGDAHLSEKFDQNGKTFKKKIHQNPNTLKMFHFFIIPKPTFSRLVSPLCDLKSRILQFKAWKTVV